ncbi:MAG: O-antigen ligase family protein [Herbinix sp.]|jgi:O-antigen ligase|nr:O-antigen ligase family protein [Herbinix sp.]
MDIKQYFDITNTKENIITLAAGTIFLPYIFTATILITLAIYIILNKDTRKLIFQHKDSGKLEFFFFFILIVPYAYGNWLGFIVGICIILAAVLGLYMRSIMTHEIYENVLTQICFFSIIGTSCAVTQKYIIPLLDHDYSTNRISAMFFHPNYFGTIAGTVIIICAYKILTGQEKKWMYYGIALMNVISIYLCKSMFAWVEVFVGITVLLYITKMHHLLVLWVFTAAVAGFVIFVLDIQLIPRLSEAGETFRLRIAIWDYAMEQIKESPIIGHGPMSYVFLSHKLGRVVPHAHSIYIDMMLNYGLAGVSIFLLYFMKYFTSIFRVCFKENQPRINALILSVTAAALVHGITDLTLMWVQTMPLFVILIAGFGAYEREEAVVKVQADYSYKEAIYHFAMIKYKPSNR